MNYSTLHTFPFLPILLTDTQDNDCIVRILAEQMDTHSAHPPIGYYRPYVCYRLRYIPPYEAFTELKHLILTINGAKGLSPHYTGLVAINIYEWLEHEREWYFEVFIKFLVDQGWQTLLTIGNGKESSVHKTLDFAKAYTQPILLRENAFTDSTELIKQLNSCFSNGHLAYSHTEGNTSRSSEYIAYKSKTYKSRSLYQYESDWRPYTFPAQFESLASVQEIEHIYPPINLCDKIESAGVPFLSNGQTASLNTSTEHTVVFAGTGRKKTRAGAIPMLDICIAAGESFVFTDVKGEVSTGVFSNRILWRLQEAGYKTICLNLRSFDGDGFNLLSRPQKLMRQGQTEDAEKIAGNIVKALSRACSAHADDPFWDITGTRYDISIVNLLLRYCSDSRKVNMLSAQNLCSDAAYAPLLEVSNMIPADPIKVGLDNILSSPERTRKSTIATASSYFYDFSDHQSLLRMMSHSTFKISDLYKKRTAILLVIPDETSAYDRLAGVILQQFIEELLDDAYHMGGRLPRRVNFILDEVCSFHLPELGRMLATHRSRNIRYYLLCQSLQQLKQTYPEDADTILANTQNLLFLGSPDLDLLKYISTRSGTTTETASGLTEPLISVQNLKALQKHEKYAEAVYINSTNNLVFTTRLPDIDQYKTVPYDIPSIELPKTVHPPVPVCSAEELLADVTKATRKQKQNSTSAAPDSNENQETDSSYEEFRKQFDRLYASINKSTT